MNKKLLLLYILPLILGISSPAPVNAQINISKLFNDHMVIQHDVVVPVWGWGRAGEKIDVIFNEKRFSAITDQDGKWMVKLSPTPVGGPFKMTVISENEKLSIKDIMVGDVWVCSGQSNMEWMVAHSSNAKKEIANATDKKIRHFKIPHSQEVEPSETLSGGEWQLNDPKNTGTFTAVGYFFARELRKEVDRPIGLLNASWGGSAIEPWMSWEALDYKNQKAAKMYIEKERQAQITEAKSRIIKKFGSIQQEDQGLLADGSAPFAHPSLNTDDWKETALPGLWRDIDLREFDGVIWYRKTINLSEEQVQRDATLHLGPIDDEDITWINGQKIGATKNALSTNRKYSVSKGILKEGKNNITLRITDHGYKGGMYGSPDQLFLKVGSEEIPLDGTWNYKPTLMTLFAPVHNHIAMGLYNKMIHPLLDFPIKGVIWYQGETNASPERALKYEHYFSTMIKDWRSQWNSGQFPFLFVQLANFQSPKDQPSNDGWAMLREAQSKTLKVPNTGQAVIIDIGEADDIHPRNKQDVGERLSLIALHKAYGKKDIIFSGPVYQSMEISENKIILSFDHIAEGLKSKDRYGYLKSFAIAGADQKFVWAKAEIVDNKVIVWNADIPNPVAVRYAWEINPQDANLYNSEDLPTSPFRTDNWDLK